MIAINVNNKVINVKNSWEDLTVQDFLKLEQVTNSTLSEGLKTIKIVSILSNIPVDTIKKQPVSIYKQLLDAATFITTVPDVIKKQKVYEIRGHRYTLQADITKINTAQYIDYQAIMKNNPGNLQRLVAIFLIPEGKQYNDGYDFEEVVEDVKYMKFLDLNTISFFLRRQLSTFIVILTDCFKKHLKRELTKKELKSVEDPLLNMALSLWSSESVK